MRWFLRRTPRKQKRPSRRKSRHRPLRHPLCFQALEPRQLLAADIEFDAATSQLTEDGLTGTGPALVVGGDDLTGTPAADRTVNFIVTGGSATDGMDFTTTGSFVVPEGDYSTTPATFDLIAEGSLTVNDDPLVELDENILLMITTTGSALSLGDADGDGPTRDTTDHTISDNDTATFTIDDVIFNESDGSATFTVSLDKPLDVDVVIDVDYADVSATGSSGGVGADYDNDTDQVTFTAGDTSGKTVTVAYTDDNIVEATETFTASLSTVTALGGRSVDLSDTGTGSIEDNDTAFFTIDDVMVNELGGTATFTVSLDKPIDIAYTVNVDYTDVTATGSSGGAGADYDNDPDQVTFGPLDTAGKMVTVAITNDNIVEATETFTAMLSAGTPSGGRSTDFADTGTGTISDDDVATFTIDDVSVNEAAGTATFTVSLDLPLDVDVTIDVDYADGTATGSPGGIGADFDNNTDQVTFFAGDTTDKMVTVAITDDNIVEATEMYTAMLSTMSAIGDHNLDLTDTGMGTITDNDTATFTINNVTVNEGAGTATFTISLSNPIDIDVDIDVDYTDVNATGSSGGVGADYDNDPDQATFAANSTMAQTVTVAITDDNLLEVTETFTAALSTATALGGRSTDLTDTGTGTIIDNDVATFSIDDVMVNEADGTLTFTVSLDRPFPVDVVVDVNYTDVEATGSPLGVGADYDNTADQVVFLAGDNTDKTVTVAITDDSIIEITETFIAALSTLSPLGGFNADLTDTGTGTITDNDTAAFTIDDVIVNEADGTLTFTISLDNALEVDVVLDVTYTNVTATGASGGAGADFDNDPDQVTFLAGDTTDKMVTVGISEDNIVEITESFTAVLSTMSAIGDRMIDLSDTGTGAIEDNDTATFTIDDVTVNEGDGTATFTISLDNPISTAIAIDVNYTDVSATGSSGGVGADYDNDPDQVTFAAGDTTDHTVTVAITDDNILEGTETFTAALSSMSDPFGGRDIVLTDTGTGTINDNDVATVTVNDIMVNEGDGTATFTVSLDRPLDIDLVVDVNYMDGAATGSPLGIGADYDNNAGQVTFLAGDNTDKMVTVAITDDTLVERDETFTALLSTATSLGGRIVDLTDTGTATIDDNDTAEVAFALDTSSVAEDGTPHTVDVTLTLLGGATELTEAVTVDVVDLLTGTAGDGGFDYTFATPTTVTFNPGVGNQTQQVSIAITNDMLVEASETIDLQLQNVETLDGQISLAVPTDHTVTITDNDIATFAIDDVTVNESDGTLMFTVSLDNPIDTDVELDVTFTDVSATGSAGGAGADYDNGTIPIMYTSNSTGPSGIFVTITNDNIVEATETFTMMLTATTPLGDRSVDLSDTGTGTITDNDTATFTIDDATVNEFDGMLTFTVSLDTPIDIDVAVDVSYSDVSATGSPLGIGADYDNIAGQVTFVAGDTTDKMVSVAITDDSEVESDETFTASLSTATALDDRDVILTDTGTGTITDNDGFDFGDAPDPLGGTAGKYPTLFANDGARHKLLAGGPTLGPLVDEDPNGQPNADATGDDSDGDPAGDDEDGVTFSAAVIASGLSPQAGSVDVDLQNSGAGPNLLNAWIDFNRDGDWDDAGEQIFTDFDLGTTNGVQTLGFTIPQDTGDNVACGMTFARFRVSTVAGLTPRGEAADGEVEDHKLTVYSTHVSNTNDSGDGSLREAIQCALDAPGVQTVTFDIPGRGPHTIGLLSPLPNINETTTIDGTTEPDYDPGTGRPVVELDGSAAGAGAHGLLISGNGSGSIIRGLAINRFSGDGIFISRRDAVTVQGNYIGTDTTGTVALGNGQAGVRVLNGLVNQVIDNVISGNASGVVIEGPIAVGNRVAANKIGTDATGTTALGNRSDGVKVGSPNNIIGGAAAGDGNLISGNKFGVQIIGTSAAGNVVLGNTIGADVTGSVAVKNIRGVVIKDKAGNNTIGGVGNSRNIISGNTHGVFIERADGNKLTGNYIGTDATGAAALANTRGVLIRNAAGNQIGEDPNVISGNVFDGIRILGSDSSGNTIRSNFIGTDATGNAAIANQNGILISPGAGGTTIGGEMPADLNVISGNTKAGVALGANNNAVLGNRIGTNSAGNAAVANETGVLIYRNSTGNTIGGTAAGDLNVISGNTEQGVWLQTGSGNSVEGNFIGTRDTGNTALGNKVGVLITSSANTIGGAAAGEGNLISGNTVSGILLEGASATGNTVAGNRIGTDDTGIVARPNRVGILIQDAPGNTIGGTAAGAGNSIAGNDFQGVKISGAGATGNVLEGNAIGLDAATMTALPNQDGVRISDFAANNRIGGAAAGAANEIAYNADRGVWITGDTGNVVSRNVIHDNGQLGLDIGTTGPTPNDDGADPDADTGPNNLQNFPEIASATLDGGNLDIEYSVPTTPGNSAFPLAVEFFLADAAGEEGQTFLGEHSYTAPGSAMVSVPSGGATVGSMIVATATDANGNTSEFSMPLTVTAPMMAAAGERSQVSRVSRAESREPDSDALLTILDAAAEDDLSLNWLEAGQTTKSLAASAADAAFGDMQ